MNKQFIITSRRDRPTCSGENYVAVVTAKNREAALYTLPDENEVIIDLMNGEEDFALMGADLYKTRYGCDPKKLEKAMFEHKILPQGVSHVKIAVLKPTDDFYPGLATWGD